jgi:hypothetical protein
MASIGIFDKEYAPHPINVNTNNPIMNLFFIENEIILLIISIKFIKYQLLTVYDNNYYEYFSNMETAINGIEKIP